MLIFECLTVLPKSMPAAQLDRLAKVLSKHLPHRASARLGLRFVSLKKMQSLNHRLMRKHRPTDVLALATNTDMQQQTPRGERVDWGEIVVCPAYAASEARRRGVDLTEELIRLVTHGALHLRGYDHRNSDEELHMFALQEKIVHAI